MDEQHLAPPVDGAPHAEASAIITKYGEEPVRGRESTEPAPILAPPFPPPWRRNADSRRAVPVCRSHVEELKIAKLYSFPENVSCQVQFCEHMAAYLAII